MQQLKERRGDNTNGKILGRGGMGTSSSRKRQTFTFFEFLYSYDLIGDLDRARDAETAE